MSPRLMHKKRKPRRAFPSRPTPQRGVGRERGKVVAVIGKCCRIETCMTNYALLESMRKTGAVGNRIG